MPSFEEGLSLLEAAAVVERSVVGALVAVAEVGEVLTSTGCRHSWVVH